MLEVGGCGCGQDHGTDHHHNHHHHHHPPTPADSLPCLLTLRHVSSVLALFWFIVLWSLSGGNIFDQILQQSLWYFNIGKGVHLSLCKLNNKYKAFNDLKIFQLKKQVTLWHVFVTHKLVGLNEIQQQKISPRQHLPSHISGRDREWLLTWPSYVSGIFIVSLLCLTLSHFRLKSANLVSKASSRAGAILKFCISFALNVSWQK